MVRRVCVCVCKGVGGWEGGCGLAHNRERGVRLLSNGSKVDHKSDFSRLTYLLKKKSSLRRCPGGKERQTQEVFLTEQMTNVYDQKRDGLYDLVLHFELQQLKPPIHSSTACETSLPSCSEATSTWGLNYVYRGYVVSTRCDTLVCVLFCALCILDLCSQLS